MGTERGQDRGRDREGVLARVVGWSVDHRDVVLALTALLIAIGSFFAVRLELDALPDITTNQVVVLTRAPGLPPDDVERRVTRVVEASVGGLPGVEGQRSLTRYGLSSVVVEFGDGVDPWTARQRVSETIAQLGGELPEGVAAPELAPYTGGLGEVFQVTFASSSRTPAELRELIELRVEPLLRSVSGVVEANTWGGDVRTFDVSVDPERARALGVTPTTVAEQLDELLGAQPGAPVSTGAGQAYLRGVSWPSTPATLGELVLRVPAADEGLRPRLIRVADVARVEEGAEPRIGAATSDGRGEVVYLLVQMAREENALEITRALRDRMDDVRRVMPDDVEIDVVYDRAQLVEATVGTVTENLLTGAALVTLVLFASLGSLRAGVITALVIPVALLGALVGMVTLGVPGNLMSLGAIDFGLLVDGAVVMVERGFHELGETPRSASRDELRRALTRGMKRVARPMVMSVFVILLVYVPILGLTGADGRLFRPMAITVVLAIFTSMVLALVVVPALAATVLRRKDVPAREPLLVRMTARAYEPVLDAAMRRPAVVLVIALGLLAAGAGGFLSAGQAFVPQLDEGDLVIQTTRAPDVSLETAVSEAGRLERALLDEVPEVSAVASRIGSPAVATDMMGVEQADVFVDLTPESTWASGRSKEDVIQHVDEVLARRAPGSEPTYTQPIQMRFNEMLGGAVTDVTVSVYGDDLDALGVTAQEIAASIRDVPGARDVRVFTPPRISSLEIVPDPMRAAQHGMSSREVLDMVAAVRIGIPAGETWDGPIPVPVRVRIDAPSRAFDMASLLINTPDGHLVTLEDVADVHFVPTPSVISREQAQRRIVVGFNVRDASLGTVVTAAKAAIGGEEVLRDGQHLEWGGQFASLEEAYRRLAVIVPLVLVSILLLLFLMFRAAGPTLLIFLNVPFATVGGIIALVARGMPVSISAAVGFIALSGIAVLNGVVLMSTILEHRAAGWSPMEAATRAARERMRPVMMTALVAALGFLPMALATGVGAEVQRPLATVVVAGLVTSTFLTLVIIPALYAMLGTRRRRAG